jgi:L-malate glycosyltransferase
MRRSAGSRTGGIEVPGDGLTATSSTSRPELNNEQQVRPRQDAGETHAGAQDEGGQEPIRQLRVLSLIKGLDIGGAEQLLAGVAAAWDPSRISHEVAFLTPERHALVTELESLGVRVHCLSVSGRELDLRWAGRLRRLLQEGGFDILHSHLRYPASFGRLVVRSLPAHNRPRLVFTEHNIWGADVLLSRMANRLTFSLDDAQIAVSSAVADSIPPRRRHRVNVLVHGLRIPPIDAAIVQRDSARAEFGIGADELVVGTVANLRPQKGYEVLLHAARIIRDEGLPVRFISVGHGPEEASIRATRHQLGLDKDFLMLGARSDALRVAAAFDVFVLSSHFEGLPVAVMEALALGVPVVATRVGGVPEVVRAGIDGLIVPTRRPDLLAAAIRQLVLDPDQRSVMAEAAKLRGRRYDIAAAAARLESIYREVLAVPPGHWRP